MGNAESNIDDDPLEQFTSEGEKGTSGDSSITDYSVLLDEETLKKALSKYPDVDLPPIARHSDKIRKWLNSVNQHGMDVMVTLDEFVDTVKEFGVPQEECKLFFHHLDRYGENSIAAVTLLGELTGLSSKLSNILTGLIPCRLEPNICDVFVDDKSSCSDFGPQLMQFLQRNRASSDQLVSTSLEVHHSTMKLRDMYVKACFSANISGPETAEDSPEGQRVTISKCYSNIAVSTSQGSMNNLLDSNPQTYWQSNGSPRTHWIRFTILSGIVISELAISVDTGDESYMPHHVSISVGNVPTSLKELKTVFIPKETTGKFVLIRALSNPYKYVQVNIRRCHRDGCDTRVRGIHVRGCRFVAAAQPSVFDSVAIWYLSMMSTTAQAAMPLAPTLKPLLLQQTKGTLCSLKPLALSPSSKDKPEMLDIFVVAELTKFVKSLCQKGDPSEMDMVDPEQLSILLKYMLIIGDVSGILDTLQCVLENMHLTLPCQPLLKDLASVTTEKRNRRSISIHLKIESCDGGQKDDEYKIENCINKTTKPSEPSSSARPYVTEEGKKVVNIVVGHHSGSKLDVQKVTLLGQKGGQSPKLAVVFLLKDLPKSGNLFEHFTKYDTLGKAELEQLVDKGGLEPDPTQAKPEAVVSMGVEEEVAVTFEKCTPCSYVYVKFLGTKEENAERMGIQKLAVHGQALQDCDALLEYHSILATVVPIPEESDVPSSTLVGRVIGFLIHMLLDLKVIKDRLISVEQDLSSIAEGHLAVQSLTLEKIWSLYFPFAMESKPTSKKLACLCLLMLYSALPFVSQASDKSDSGSSDMCKTILTHLCSLIDSESEDQAIKDIAKECITSGIPVFYPSPSTRQDHLMEMLSGVSQQQSRSWMLTFKGLCQYFVLKDSFKLLQLPVQPNSASEVKVDHVMSVLTKILNVTCQRVDLNTEETSSEERDILVHLLQAIQQNFFHWCSKVAREKKRELRELASSLVLRYSILFLEKMEDLLSRCVHVHSSLAPAQHVPKTVATSVLPQFLYFLNAATFSNSFYCLKLLQPLIVLLNSLISIQKKYPELFPTPISKSDTPELESESKPDEDKKEPHLLNVWVRESSSTSEQEVSKDEKFFCPVATKMVVEFDSSSSTSSRFDKLEFMSGSTSSVESVHGSAGSSDWPKSLDFATSELSFRFNTVSSNSSWVYKFVVKAYGPKPTSLTYFSDLQFTVAHLIGNLCSRVIGSQHMEEDDKDVAEEDEESSDKRRLEMSRKAEKWLISSDVWKKMFRGGVTDRYSRSLSTMHSSIPAGSELNKLLTDLAHGTGSMDIIEQCRAAQSGPQMHYGGPQVDKAINAVFAALVWHSQEVRDELSKSGDKPLIATQGVRDAYAMAQYLRRELVEARQKVITARDTDETSSNHSAMDEDKPVNDCLQKALFLLKFAGLMKAEKPRLAVEAATPSRSAFIQKYKQWQKGRSASSSTEQMSESQVASVVETEKSLAQKYPSFRIMMEFLRKTSVTKEMVERFLEHRQKAAKNLSAVLWTIFDLLQSMDIFSNVGLTFLCQLLSCQYSFAGHYIRDLEGCGLEVENEARKAYSQITNHLLEKLKPYTQLKAPTKPLTMEVLLTKAYLLHLLDVQWQNYDMLFISESHLPEFLLSTAIQVGFERTGSNLPKQENEDEMLERHKLFLRHLSVVKSSTTLSDLMANMELGSLDKEAHLFIVSAVWHTEKLSIHVQCDGCTTSISSTWYRDMEAMDLDLCKRCFFERPDKRPVAYHISHKFIELRYLCDCCRIMITSHRLHCETKTDFDLCLGCFRQKEQEGTLDPKDRWTLYPLTLHNPEKDKVNTYYTTSQEHVTAVPLASVEKPKEKKLELLKAYVSQHGFLQFTQICLSTSQVLNMSESDVEESYLNSVAVIYFDCLKLLTFCLRCAIAKIQGTPKEDTDSVAISQETQSSRPKLLRVTSVTDHPEAFSEMGEMEKVFCYNKLDKLMGLLALMLPIDMQLPRWVTENPNVSQLLSERLLPALIDISRSENPEHSVQSLCLLAQFLVRISPTTADQACQVAQGEGTVGQGGSGPRTIEYLCSTGALHLEKSDFASASTVSRILIRLGGCDSWKEAVAAQLKSCLEKKPQEMIMSDIFKLYTLAGFPGLPCIGTVMEFGEGSETRRAVITSVPSNQVSLITLDKRETMLSSLADLRMEKPPVGCVDESHIEGLVNVLSQLHRMSGSAFTTETFFVLSLTLKALRTALTTVDPGNLEPVLSDPKMMSWIGLVARKPTEMDKKWLLHHLEAYLVNSYQQKTAKVSPGSGDGAQKEQEEKKEPVKKDPKEGLSETANEMFDTMMEAFNCSAAVLRAAYDISKGDVERWLVLLQECFEDSMFKPSDRILDKAKEWEPQPVQVIAEKIQESGDDSGLVNFSPRKIDIENVTAVAEIGAMKPKVSLDTKDSKDEKGKDEKMEQESLEMLLRELKKLQDSPADSSHLLKTANAVAILQAREFIVSILTHWPWRHERVLSPKVLLGETDTMKNFGMVDLICSTETDQGAKMVVRNIMEYGDPREVQELVMVAAECMGELTVGTESVEGTRKEDKKVTGTIVIPNASSLTVTFDEKSSFEGSIALTSSVSGTGDGSFEGNKLAGKMHILPGDTVNYTVTYTGEDKKSSWKMEIVGSQTGRFDTGCMILKMWLSQAGTKKWNLPLADLWPHLVLVACQNPGQKRLQVIGLLLEILSLYREMKTSDTDLAVKELDLSLLKPLWKLYYSILGEVESNEKVQLVPDIVKALTELFMVMESFGKDLGVDQPLLDDLWLNEKIMSLFNQGVCNVAFLSLGAGLNNKLSTVFVESKHKQDLEAIASLTFQPVDNGEAKEDTSDSDSNTSDDDSDDYTTTEDDDDDDNYGSYDWA